MNQTPLSLESFLLHDAATLSAGRGEGGRERVI